MYDPGSDSYPDFCSLERSYGATFAHPSGQMEHEHSAQSFDLSALSTLCRVLIGREGIPVEEVVMSWMYICQQGLTAVVDCVFKGAVSDNRMRNESLLSESNQFPFLCLGFSLSLYEIKCSLNCKTVLNGLLRPERIDHVQILFMYACVKP